MDTQSERMPQVRLSKGGNFVVEENIDALRWPEECANCGGPAQEIDTLRMNKIFKGVGEIEVKGGIPYCRVCFPKIRAGKRLDRVHFVVSLLIGIPLGIILVAEMIALEADVQDPIIFLGVAFILALAVGYGIAWLVVKLPAKLLLGQLIAEPVHGRLIEEKKADGKRGVSVVFTIPREDFAVKFAELNAAKT